MKVQKKILVVDDAKTNRALLRRIFQDDYEVCEAENGEAAMQVLHKDSDIFLVMLDLLMPVMDGYEVLAQMQKEHLLSRIPVVVVTGEENPDQQIRALDMGAADVITKPFHTKMILHRVKNLHARVEAEKLAQENRLYEQRLQQQEEMLRRSMYDEKTGVYNKTTFEALAGKLLRTNPDLEYVLVRFDIDHFQVYNEMYGTSMGEALLKKIGEVCNEHQDEEHVIFGYLGSDDFCVLIEKSRFRIDAIIQHVEKHFAEESVKFQVQFRYGIYEVGDHEQEVGIMCDRAALALRAAKERYSDHYLYYEEAMRAQMMEEQWVIGEMEKALENEEFTVYLQPQVDYNEGVMNVAEALVRWIHPEKGIISPIKFIPVFEKNGLISKLDEYVWEKVAKLIRKWIDQGLEPVPISVNLSRIDIYNPNLVEYFEDLIKRNGLTTNLLRLEITESAYMENSAQLIEMVSKLQKKGFVVEMDDFGSGYSSLNTLKDVPVDVLKLDMKFLTACSQDNRGGSILNSVMRMARWLALPVVAEGVEEANQAEYLKSIGCSLMQGYLFAKPLPIVDFEKLLAERQQQREQLKKWKETQERLEKVWDKDVQQLLLSNDYSRGAAICEGNQDGMEVVQVNTAFCRILGANRNTFANQSCFLRTIFEADALAVVKRLAANCDVGKPMASDVLYRGIAETEEKFKEPICLHVTMNCLAKEENHVVLCMTVTDVTEIRKYEKKLQELQKQIQDMKHEKECSKWI